MNKLIKNTVIFLLIFTLTAILTTYTSIRKNSAKVISDKDIQNTVVEEKGIDLYGTYNENDLLVVDLIENFSGEEIKIPQIEGLKNTQIEEKINKDIYNRCYGYIQNITVNMVEGNEINSYYNVMSNFSNIISINFYFNENGNINRIYLNYNLTTGERLKFEDLFVKDADIIGIVRKALAERMSNDDYWENVMEGDYIASFDENELYKVVKGFMTEEEKDFMFSPSTIYFNFNNYGGNIKMIDIPDNISIYTKYLTEESIYERNDIGRKNIFTLVETNYDIFKSIEYGYLEDNLWYDISFGGLYLPEKTISDDKLMKYELLENKIFNDTQSKIEEIRIKAKNNPDNFYMIFTKPVLQIYTDEIYDENNGWIYTYSNMAVTRIYTRLYEMPLEVYKNTYKDKLIDAYRYEYFVMSGGAQIISESGDGAIFKEDIDERLYDYMNDVRITKITDIFYEDSNYESVIKDSIRNFLNSFYEYTDVEVERFINTMKYELIGNQIIVTIPELEEFKKNVTLDEFPKEMIKLFDKEDNL